MPHRTFSLSDVASYLHLSEADITLLVRRGEIPCVQQAGRSVFRRHEIDAWASQRILGMSALRVREYHSAAAKRVRDDIPRHALFPEMLTPRSIDYAMTSRTKPSVLRDMVALADGTGLVCDPKELMESLQAREALCSTALPGGCALLHPRHHEPYLFVESFLALGRTIHPIHAGAQDRSATDLFFLVCCQSDALHLHVLARLCTMIQHTGLVAALRAAETADAMWSAVCEKEREILQGA